MANSLTEIKNILVTGGAGYVGSQAVKLLLDNNYKVVVADNLIFGDKGLIEVMSNTNLKLIKEDITRIDKIAKIFKDYQIDAVVHLAAVVGDPACSKQPELAKRTNWEAAVNLLDFSMKNKVKKFIFASTCSNYGKMLDPNIYVDETSLLNPVSLYAELKVKFENFMINEIDRKDNFCPVSLRFATAYGVSPRMRFDLTVNEFTKDLALGREIEVFGEQFWRPYCHVSDLARAILVVLNSENAKITYDVFNVGDTEENYQKKMIIDRIRELIPDVRVKYIHKDEDPRDYRVSFAKIKEKLGFAISRRVQDGIKEIKHLIDSGAILNPDDQIYRNS